jgi:hypothetical protein
MSLLELFSSTLSANPNVRKSSELRLREVPSRNDLIESEFANGYVFKAERESGFLINALELIETNDDPSIQLAGTFLSGVTNIFLSCHIHEESR